MATKRELRKIRRQQRRSDRKERRDDRREVRADTRDLPRDERRAARKSARQDRGTTRREQRAARQLAFKPERAAAVCSPKGKAQRDRFNEIVRSGPWAAAAQGLNTGAKALYATPEPTMITKVAGGVIDGIGYAMKGLAIAGPEINDIREELACAMVAEMEANQVITPGQGGLIQIELDSTLPMFNNRIPASPFTAGSAFDLQAANIAEEQIASAPAPFPWALLAIPAAALLFIR